MGVEIKSLSNSSELDFSINSDGGTFIANSVYNVYHAPENNGHRVKLNGNKQYKNSGKEIRGPIEHRVRHGSRVARGEGQKWSGIVRKKMRV